MTENEQSIANHQEVVMGTLARSEAYAEEGLERAKSNLRAKRGLLISAFSDIVDFCHTL